MIDVVVSLETILEDATAMLELAVEADDESLLADVQAELDIAEKRVADLEFRRMFSGEMDPNNCYLMCSRQWRHRSARLGRDAIAYVYALGGSAWL